MSDASEVVARATAAASRGYGRHADSILRQAVHGLGIRPVELILAALAAPPKAVQLADTTHTGAQMHVRYIGPSGTGVKVMHPDPAMPEATTATVCPPGETVDLPTEVATSLVDAGTFEAVEAGERPAPSASKAAWAAFAVAQGWTPDAAEQASKAELIDDLTDTGPDTDAGGSTEEND